MSEEAPPTQMSSGLSSQSWWRQPYLHLGISIVLSSAVQVLMKRGADESVHDAVFGFAGLGSLWVWASIGCQIGSLLCWLYALRTAPLNIAFNLAASAHILVPLAAWLLLGEQIHRQRWFGILLICAGVVITARQAGQVEEKL